MNTRPLHDNTPDVHTLLDAGNNPDLVRSAFACFPSGVAAVTASTEDGPAVLVVSSFQVGISLDPPLVLFAVQHTSTSWPRIRLSERIGISVLSSNDEATARQLSRGKDRLAGVDTVMSPTGAIFIRGTSAWLETSIYSVVPAGDHDVVLLQVHGLGIKPERDPLVWLGSGFRALAELPDVSGCTDAVDSTNVRRTELRAK